MTTHTDRHTYTHTDSELFALPRRVTFASKQSLKIGILLAGFGKTVYSQSHFSFEKQFDQKLDFLLKNQWYTLAKK